MTRYGRYFQQEGELNLIPLIDIMSVMVAFLLIYSTEVEVVQNTRDVQIPMSSAEAKPKQSVTVMITKDHVFVQGHPVATLAQVRESEGQVESLQAVLQRPMLVKNEENAKREITVLADKTLPFDVVQKVMETCSESEYGTISLAVLEKETTANAAS